PPTPDRPRARSRARPRRADSCWAYSLSVPHLPLSCTGGDCCNSSAYPGEVATGSPIRICARQSAYPGEVATGSGACDDLGKAQRRALCDDKNWRGRNTMTRLRSTLIACAAAAIFASPLWAQNRMPPIPADKLTDAQKKASEAFAEGRGYAVRGPFVPLLR